MPLQITTVFAPDVLAKQVNGSFLFGDNSGTPEFKPKRAIHDAASQLNKIVSSL